MRLKAKKIDIPENEPFKNDLLNRAVIIDNLTQIIRKTSESFVISIDAPWGMGKTTFLDMWRVYLQEEGIHTISFNAWENDYVSDPLASLIGELTLKLKALEGCGQAEEVDKKIEELKNLSIKVLKLGAPAIIKALTYGVLDSDAIASASEDFATKLIDEYLDSKKTLLDFKNYLSGFVKELTGETGQSFVVFIDELDRCRPRFAIEVLEVIKHLFDVPGLVFILALDEEQLSHSIQTVYGQNMDSKGYLRRFFDLSYVLPKPKMREFCHDLFQRFDLQDYINVRRQIPQFQSDVDTFVRLLVDLCDIYDLSLRDVEKLFTRFCIVAMSTPPDYYLFPPLTCLFLTLSLKDKKLYNYLMREERTISGVLGSLKENAAMENFLNDFDNHHNLVLQTNLACAFEQDNFPYYRKMASEAGMNSKRKQFADRVVEHGPNIKFNMPPNVIEYLREKIEIINNIK